MPDAEPRMMRVLGFCSIAFYCILAGLFWNHFTSTETRADDIAVFFAGTALVVAYFYGLRYLKNVTTKLIVGFAVIFAIVGFLMVPFDSTDVFFYMATGWEQSHYAHNPYSRSLRDINGILDDPLVQNQWMARNRNPYLDLPVPYGFLFALISRGIAWAGHGSFWTTLALFSFLNLLMHAGIGWLLWKSAKLIPGTNPNTVLYLYTWNPFIVLQYLGNVHNDIIVAFLVVLAAYLLLSKRPLWTIPVLAASVLIKYVTIVLIPFAFLFIVRSRGRSFALRSTVLALGVALFSALPYLPELAAFKYELILAQVSESTGSLHAFILYVYRLLTVIWPALLGVMPHFRAATKVGLWVIFAGFAIHEMHATWTERAVDPVRMIQRWAAVLFALLFVASSQFFAWYLGMLFPIAILTDRKSILADTVILLSGAHMLSFTFLRRKAIGYFLLATLLPVLFAILPRLPRLKRQIELPNLIPS